ncbi:MAG: DUF507 family protein [Nitrospirae bacterium]|nr:DUF507 family protein [Nitrospirota bacterium]
MRVPKTWVPLIAKKVVDDLLVKKMIAPKVAADELLTETEKLILEELMVEDRVNDEVREILKKYTGEIEKGRLDYRRMFELTKKKIIEERGIVI